jgi:hypothetical protein
MALLKVLSCSFLEGWGNPRETSAVKTDGLAQIRTGHVPNTSLERYSYTIFLPYDDDDDNGSNNNDDDNDSDYDEADDKQVCIFVTFIWNRKFFPAFN